MASILSRYPQVVYSMLRQSEDEPEDVLGEILINIGLAGPEDRRRSSESSSSSEPSDHEVDASELDGDNFTSIPLKRDEDSSALVTNSADESDESTSHLLTGGRFHSASPNWGERLRFGKHQGAT